MIIIAIIIIINPKCLFFSISYEKIDDPQVVTRDKWSDALVWPLVESSLGILRDMGVIVHVR